MSLAPDLTLAQVVKGAMYWYLHFNVKTAINALEQALEINSTDTRALIHYSWLMSESGLHVEALESGRRAVESDPFNNAAQQALGQAYYLNRNFEASLEAFHLAQINMAIGNEESALDGFEAAYEARGKGLFELPMGHNSTPSEITPI